jgi:hypothetical protein
LNSDERRTRGSTYPPRAYHEPCSEERLRARRATTSSMIARSNAAAPVVWYPELARGSPGCGR